MRHYLTVLGYSDDDLTHTCEDSEGYVFKIDLMVRGDLPPKTKPKELIGKRISVSFLTPYIQIGHGVKIEPTNSGLSDG